MTTVKDIQFSDIEIDGEKFYLDLYLPNHVTTNKRECLQCQFTCARSTMGKLQTDCKQLEGIVTKRRVENDESRKNNTRMSNKKRDTLDRYEKQCNVENANCGMYEKQGPNEDENLGMYEDQMKQRPNDEVSATKKEKVQMNHVTTNESKERSKEPEKHPFVVFIHGGGWRRGAKDAWKHYLYFDVNFLVCFFQLLIGTYSNIGDSLANNGVGCAVISYPLTEAANFVILFEMLLSFLQCYVFVAVASLPPIAALFFLKNNLSSSTGSISWEVIFLLDRNSTSSIKVYILGIFFLTNFLTTVLILLKYQEFRVRTTWTLATALSLATFVLMCSIFHQQTITTIFLGVCCFLFVFNQTVIFKRRCMRQDRTIEDQVNVVIDAVTWCKTFCAETNLSSELYLMGHSAGGHLAALIALTDDRQNNNQVGKLKGVISVSGVYDVLCLNGRLLKHAYLFPTFGENFDAWISSSPTYVTKSLSSHECLQTRFLLLSAERDLFLKQQSLDFHGMLREKGVNSKHFEIPRTNHFSIITGTRTDLPSALGHTLAFIKSV